jgi:hypothetical protein
MHQKEILGRVFKIKMFERREENWRQNDQPRCSTHIVGIIYRTCFGGG